MGKAEFGTPKYISKQIKSKGLQKVKFYCQICEKQCRDANGFKNHILSASHVGRMQNLGNSKQSIEKKVNEYSISFEQDFLRLLKAAHGYKKVNANKYYQEYILNDKDHIHLNATRYSSLSIFIIKMVQQGKIAIDGADLDKLGNSYQGGGDGEDVLNMQYTMIYIPEKNPKDDNKRIKEDYDEKSDDQVYMKMLQRKIEDDSKKFTEKEDDQKKNNIGRSSEGAHETNVVNKAPIKISIVKNSDTSKKKSMKERRVALGFKKK